jgi:FKBP-type peptidyl-prolyl cis-trans isomerase
MKKWLGLITILAAVACSGSEETVTDPVNTDPPTFAPELGINLDNMVHTQSGLFYMDVQEGTGDVALAGWEVAVQFTGWLPDGTQFDSSVEGEPFRFVTGFNQVIIGFDEGVMGMKVGGIRRMVLPPFIAYGIAGRPPAVPPNSWLVFEVELIDGALRIIA